MTPSLKGLPALVSNIAVQRPARSLCSPAAADRARWADKAPEAVLWGTRSSKLRDNPATVHDYFFPGPFPPSYKVVLGEQRIRVYGDVAINTGTYTFSEDREGKLITRPARFSFVYRNRDGRWLIVDHHSSAIPAPAQ